MVLAVDIPDEMPDEDSEWFREAACHGVIQFRYCDEYTIVGETAQSH